jgi:hypothetical protein
MDVAQRVHLMPVGYENDRIVLSAERFSADRVLLLEYDDQTAHPSYGETIRERLDDAGIDHETIQCDIFDFYDSLGTIAELATRLSDHAVYVNLATGSKVTAIGGMIACMATGATPYYVRAEHYAAETDGDVAEGIRDVTELPTYPMEHPDRQQVAVMAHLDAEGGVTKRALIDFGEREGLPFLAEHDAANRKSQYRLLDSHVLKPLADTGYVTVTERGRSKLVDLTDAGRNTLRAFRYLIEEER